MKRLEVNVFSPINPDTREFLHNPTGACLRYDDNYKLTLLDPRVVESDRISRIMAGAEEYLQQYLGLNPGIRFTWVDVSGRQYYQP
jgi:hypothetical protein